jgi:hypothetical protein
LALLKVNQPAKVSPRYYPNTPSIATPIYYKPNLIPIVSTQSPPPVGPFYLQSIQTNPIANQPLITGFEDFSIGQ